MVRADKKYSIATIAVALALVFPSFAYADSTPAPTLSPDSHLGEMDQFKRDRDAFIATKRDRENRMRDINSAFKSAVDKANQDSRNALQGATTPLQKSTIAATRRNAIDTAISTRDSAIAALGAEPTPPAEPMRQPKQMGMSDKGGKKR